VQQWLDLVLQNFDNHGLGAAIAVLENIDGFVEKAKIEAVRCSFSETSGFLQHFIRGLGGRDLKISSDLETFTNTEALFLPESVDLFPAPQENFTLYKLTAVHLWAQTWYGTWQHHILEAFKDICDSSDRIEIFNRLECIRLDACIARDFPGLNRELQQFQQHDSESVELWDSWRANSTELEDAGATAADSLKLIDKFADVKLPPLQAYQGEMYLDRIRQTFYSRVEQEKTALQKALEKILEDNTGTENDAEMESLENQTLELSQTEDSDGQESNMNLKLTLDGQPVDMSEDLKELLGSIIQDFGEIPDSHMDPSEQSDYSDELLPQSNGEADNSELDLQNEGAFQYKEWDCTRQRFREDFCTLRELTVPPGDEAFIDETLEKHKGVLKEIKRSFEAVLGESRPQRRQCDGDDIDLGALIEAYTDLARGEEMSEHLYTRYKNVERNIAVMFMVDMSGSTLGWVNNAERESLVLLCEALQLLGDRYAIFGFSGRTNKRCEVYSVKEFNESYSESVKQRISGIRPKAYTRMGVAIRHLGKLLQDTQARTKLLITLSDGRPEDYGGYKGQYGIEDTRHALLEMKQEGVHAFCITIDNEAQEYLPHMYGNANYAVIDEVEKLPLKVADIYRRLTT
jgi:nitric oxide reductase NorD protein